MSYKGYCAFSAIRKMKSSIRSNYDINFSLDRTGKHDEMLIKVVKRNSNVSMEYVESFNTVYLQDVDSFSNAVEQTISNAKDEFIE